MWSLAISSVISLLKTSMPAAPQLHISQILPQRSGRHAGAAGGALVSHFSYHPQRDYLIHNTTLLEQYERVAEGACGRERQVDYI
jgi:hypothetical protein